jgi:hypothetical protein
MISKNRATTVIGPARPGSMRGHRGLRHTYPGVRAMHWCGAAAVSRFGVGQDPPVLGQGPWAAVSNAPESPRSAV